MLKEPVEETEQNARCTAQKAAEEARQVVTGVYGPCRRKGRECPPEGAERQFTVEGQSGQETEAKKEQVEYKDGNRCVKRVLLRETVV